jgi:hypothetical protein
MVEVFKTDVKDPDHAKMLVDRIHAIFAGYTANFDLEDCDRILRVVSSDGFIQTSRVMNLLDNYGCHAEILPDDIPEVFSFEN